jgi:hypothetical protein
MNDNTDPRSTLIRQQAAEISDLRNTLKRVRGHLADARRERDYHRQAYGELLDTYRYLLASPDDYHAIRAVAVEDNLL